MPVFPNILTPVTERLRFCRDADTVVYFFDGLPVFSHHVMDIVSFHMITASYCVSGHTDEAEVVRVFNTDVEGVSLAVELYEIMGPNGFYPGRGRAAAIPPPPMTVRKRKRKPVKSL
jgi:hypothetical protein